MSTPSAPDAAALAALLREAAEAVAGLPRTIESELIASRGELPIEVIRGSERQWEAWAEYAAAVPPRAPINLYPSLEVLRTLIAPDLDEVVRPHTERTAQAEVDAATAPFRPRGVIAAEAVVDESDHAVLRALGAVGMEIRLAREVPSWLYADAGVLSALPLTWGEHPPSSIVVIRDPAVSTALAALLESIWRAAVPYPEVTADWQGTVQLAGLGLTDAAIAAAQGVSERTVQRRFAEAMQHFGVASRFELGAAWARAGGAPSTS